MSMTVVNAKLYIADVIGGRQSPQAIDAAAQALARSYSDWQGAKFWQFLLKDTSLSTSVTGVTATQSSATVNAPSTGAFDFVNVGQTVTVSGTATLAADTTVSSVTRGTDGVITSITLSNAFGGTTDSAATLTFSADIPVLQGVDEYNLPNDFDATYSARLTQDPKGVLQYIDQKYWDKYQDDQTIQLPIDGYLIFNPVSSGTQNYGTRRMKLVGRPDQNNTLRLRYYREFNQSGTNIDMPDDLLYKFLDYARMIALLTKRAQDNPSEFAQSVEQTYAEAQAADEEHDDDEDQRMKSAYEVSVTRPIVGNGMFSPWPWE